MRPPALSAVYLCGGQSELQLLLGHVPHLKVDGGTEEVQGHHGNLVHVSDSTADGKSASHHVCISNGFSLKTKEESSFVFFPREDGSEGMSVRQGPSFLILLWALSLEGSHSMTSTPSKSSHFLKVLPLSCLLLLLSPPVSSSSFPGPLPHSHSFPF